jgi:putative phosphoribosyl transferase
MNDHHTQTNGNPISIHTEHGSLHGLLVSVANPRALIVLAHAGVLTGAPAGEHTETPAETHGNAANTREEALATTLRQAGMTTLVIDLMTHQETHFVDVVNNVPLLAKRLLDCLALIKRQMSNGELSSLPIGLCAAGSVSPAAIRVAGLRDHDIAAVACRGGLIDLAGMLYLRSLEAPLIVFTGEKDSGLLASNQRAFKEIACTKALEIIPESDSHFDSAGAFDNVSQKIVHWFNAHCTAT